MRFVYAALIAAALVAGPATAFAQQNPTGDVLTERPRGSLGTTRDQYQDSTLNGGVNFNFPQRPPVPPPPPPPPPDPCVTDPSSPGCGGGGTTNPPPSDPPMAGGCYVDTRALDQWESPNCYGEGESETDAILFSVGDELVGDTMHFSKANTYRVEWTGSCAGNVNHYCNLQGVPNGLYTTTATIYRLSDNALVATFTMKARKNVVDMCDPSKTFCNVVQ